jgi:hypothetical protein
MVTDVGLAPEVDSCNDEILSCVGVMACVVCAGGGGVAGDCGLVWSWQAGHELRRGGG